MLIYNVTTMVSWAAHDKWLQWMQDEHIPEVLSTGCFEKHQFVRMLETDETEGPTYATQYYAVSRAAYLRYMELYAPALRQKSIEKWGEQCISFRSLMELVQ